MNGKYVQGRISCDCESRSLLQGMKLEIKSIHKFSNDKTNNLRVTNIMYG